MMMRILWVSFVLQHVPSDLKWENLKIGLHDGYVYNTPFITWRDVLCYCCNKKKSVAFVCCILVRKNGVYVTTALSHSLSFLLKIPCIPTYLSIYAYECVSVWLSVYFIFEVWKENFWMRKITCLLAWVCCIRHTFYSFLYLWWISYNVLYIQYRHIHT